MDKSKASVDKVFGRNKKGVKGGYDARPMKRRQFKESVAALTENGDFKVWFKRMLDEMCGFISDQRELSAYGQGIRAAAGKMEELLLVAPEGVKFLADIHQQHFAELHKGIVAALNQDNIGANHE